MIKSVLKLSLFLFKIICCGCVLKSPRRGDTNTHQNHMLLCVVDVYKNRRVDTNTTIRFYGNTLNNDPVFY